MPASDLFPSGVDSEHVRSIATIASGGGAVLLVGGLYAARVYLSDRPAAESAHTALRRVGYQVGRATGNLLRRDLIVAGWSAEALESRLTAMRDVLHALAGQPAATAAAALAQLGHAPVLSLPGEDGRQLVGQAAAELRAWISATSGIHTPSDPRARPDDPPRALRLAATRRAEEAIDDLVTRHVQVAELAVALYPALRQRMSHDQARESAIRRAAMAFDIRRHIAQDTSPFLRRPGQEPRKATPSAVTSPDSSPPGAAAPRPGASSSGMPAADQESPSAGSWAGSARGTRRWLRAAQDFPVTDKPTAPLSRPPSIPGPTRPRGRNFPSGRAGRHR